MRKVGEPKPKKPKMFKLEQIEPPRNSWFCENPQCTGHFEPHESCWR